MRCQRVSYRFTGVVTADRPSWGGSFHDALAAALEERRPWRPPSDLLECDDEYVVRLDVPGVQDDDVQVLVFADAVVIEGERRVAPAQNCRRFHVAEVRHGAFRLALRLASEVDVAASAARLERGVLTVRLPKAAGGGTP